MTLSKLRVVLEASTGQFNRAMKATGTAFKRTNDAAKRLGAGMLSLKNVFKAALAVFVVRQIAEVTKALFMLGAAVEETQDKFNVVFGQSAAGVQNFLDQFATAAGLSNRVAQDFAATTAAMVQGMGFAESASAGLAEQVLRLSADLASFNDLPTAEVLRAVQGAITGEREQLKRLGIVIQEVDVRERALHNTRKDSASALTQQEKVLATMELLYEKAGRAVGNLSDTFESSANVAKRVGARIETLKENFSSGLMPVMSVLIGTVDDNSTAFDALNTAIEAMGKFMATAVVVTQILGSELAALTPRLQVFGVVAREAFAQTLERFGLGGLAGLVRPEIEDVIAAFEDLEGQIQRARDAADEMAQALVARLIAAFEGVEEKTKKAKRSIEDFSKQLELTRDQMPPIIQQFRLLGHEVVEIPRIFEEMEQKISRTNDALVGFALDFSDRIGRATTEGASAFDGFVNRVLQGLARIAAELVIFNTLSSIFGGNNLFIQSLGARIGIPAGGGATSGGGGLSLVAAGGPPVVFHQTVNFNIAALDGPSVAEVLRSQKATIATVVAEAAQENTNFRRALR